LIQATTSVERDDIGCGRMEMMGVAMKEGFSMAVPYQRVLSAREKTVSLLGMEWHRAMQREIVFGVPFLREWEKKRCTNRGNLQRSK
jgi:hypothetical protein